MKIKIDIEKCKGCRLCETVCPMKVITFSEGVNKRGVQYVVLEHPEKCTGCGLCMIMCPDCALELEEAAGETGGKIKNEE
ncbi:MAG: ferredoxin family protein [Candidatus Omnitrophota bacterium]